jgi:hypothetical protein
MNRDTLLALGIGVAGLGLLLMWEQKHAALVPSKGPGGSMTVNPPAQGGSAGSSGGSIWDSIAKGLGAVFNVGGQVVKFVNGLPDSSSETPPTGGTPGGDGSVPGGTDDYGDPNGSDVGGGDSPPDLSDTDPNYADTPGLE